MLHLSNKSEIYSKIILHNLVQGLRGFVTNRLGLDLKMTTHNSVFCTAGIQNFCITLGLYWLFISRGNTETDDGDVDLVNSTCM